VRRTHARASLVFMDFLIRVSDSNFHTIHGGPQDHWRQWVRCECACETVEAGRDQVPKYAPLRVSFGASHLPPPDSKQELFVQLSQLTDKKTKPGPPLASPAKQPYTTADSQFGQQPPASLRTPVHSYAFTHAGIPGALGNVDPNAGECSNHSSEGGSGAMFPQ
jgi:hypothetical protein